MITTFRNRVRQVDARALLITAAVLALAFLLGRRASPLWLGLLAAGIGGVVLLARPVLGLPALVLAALVAPLEISTGTEVKLNLASLLVPVLLAVWLMGMVRRRQVRIVSSRVNAPLALFLAASLFSLLIGRSTWDPMVPVSDSFLLVQLAQWAIFAFSAGAFWLTANLATDERRLWRLTAVFLLAGGGLASLRVLPGVGGLISRVTTLAFDRAPFWVLLTAVAGGQLLFNRDLSWRWRALLVVALGGSLFYAFVQQQEAISNWIGLGAVLSVLVWLRFPRLRWPVVILLIALLAAGVLFPRLYQFAGGDEEWSGSGGSRLVLIERVISVTMRNPVTGLGPAAYRPYANQEPLRYLGAYWTSPMINSHNNYVDLFAHGGVLGLALFAWFAIAFAATGLRLRSRYTRGFAAGYTNGMLALGAGSLVIMLFADWILPFVYNIGFPGFQASVLVWLFMGGLVAIENWRGGEGERGREGERERGSRGERVSVDLSVIIVNWNTRELLAACLRSVEGERFKAAGSEAQPSTLNLRPLTAEVFVIDNASTDGSARMVRERFPWVKLIENAENVGFAAANNQGIGKATGRYVLLLNSDTVAPPAALEALVAFGDAHPRAGIVGARLVDPDGSFQAGPNRFPTLATVVLESWGLIQRLTRNPYYPSYPPERSQTSQRCDWVGGACLLARRTAIDQAGVLDESFFMNSEEVDWCYRMKQHGWEVWYAPAAAIVHLGGASAQRSTAAQRLRTYRGKVLFLAKHHGRVAGRLAQAHFQATSALKALAYGARFLIGRDRRYRDQAASHWVVAQEADWP